MRWSEIINETSTSGGTASGSVATSIAGSGSGAIGVGFDPNGHQGIYQSAKKKKPKPGKPALLKR
jgi:hypothetical protein